MPTEGSATNGDPTVTSSTEETNPKASLCYGEADAEAAADCFAELVNGGDIDQSEVPWFLQHVECGAAERNWTGEYYMLADAEFVALVGKVAPCYQALVASGDIVGRRAAARDHAIPSASTGATRTSATTTTRRWPPSSTAPSADHRAARPGPPGACGPTRP